MLTQIARVARLPEGFRTELPPVRRSPHDEVLRTVRLATGSPLVAALLEAVDAIVLVLNENRQIVAFSGATAVLARTDQLYGRRPGEALGCVNAQTPAGCGAQPACATCGALGAILTAARTRRAVEAECLLRTVLGEGDSLELSVRAAPFAIDDVPLTAVSLRDISAEKRRDALEQVFLHDVVNTVSGVRGWVTRLRRSGCDVSAATERLEFLTGQLEREITDHRDLVLAEKGELTVHPARLVCTQLLRDVESVFASHALARDRRIVVEADPPGLELWSDPALLLRVLGNMVRNALEATAPGGEVRVRAEPDGGRAALSAVRLSVHNASVMPVDVQHRVFVRSFSTKGGRGRGLGTYGMKLIGERHLGGEVSFSSAQGAGTTFWIRLPVGGPPPARSITG